MYHHVFYSKLDGTWWIYKATISLDQSQELALQELDWSGVDMFTGISMDSSRSIFKFIYIYTYVHIYIYIYTYVHIVGLVATSNQIDLPRPLRSNQLEMVAAWPKWWRYEMGTSWSSKWKGTLTHQWLGRQHWPFLLAPQPPGLLSLYRPIADGTCWWWDQRMGCTCCKSHWSKIFSKCVSTTKQN